VRRGCARDWLERKAAGRSGNGWRIRAPTHVMAKRAALAFNRELQDLFERRTHWLRAHVSKPGPGRAPALNRATVTRGISRLQELASKCLATQYARREFDKTVDQHRQWHVTSSKGRGWRAKKKTFGEWYAGNIDHRSCVYAFWHKSRCLYVGKTDHGRGRPQSHFSKIWFPRVTRIDVYSTSQKSQIPRLECLAIHRFDPSENRHKAATKKWTKKCPVCVVRAEIKKELRRIFSLRHG